MRPRRGRSADPAEGATTVTAVPAAPDWPAAGAFSGDPNAARPPTLPPMVALRHTAPPLDEPSAAHSAARRRRRFAWPLPALVAWLAAWAFYAGLRAAGADAAPALLAGQLPGLAVALAWTSATRWRRGIVAAGFPLSAIALGAGAGLPAWGWLAPLALLLLAYPLRAWRDAPLFPTPLRALEGAAERTGLAPGSRLLDAGCGLGHGLAALRREWPRARIEGIEWSAPLALAAALRCRSSRVGARVQRGDMWAVDWSGYALVYLFQRPESMSRAWLKACAEMAPGSWLASLEFVVPGVQPQAAIEHPGGPTLWLYRTPRRGGRSTLGDDSR